MSSTDNKYWQSRILQYIDGELTESGIIELSNALEQKPDVRQIFQKTTKLEWELVQHDKPSLLPSLIENTVDSPEVLRPVRPISAFMKVAALIALSALPVYLLSLVGRHSQHPVDVTVIEKDEPLTLAFNPVKTDNPIEASPLNIMPSGGGRVLSSGVKREPGDTGLPKVIRFNQHVRPILSDKCFFCHGPDEHERGGDLRLDIREEAIRMEAIVPGNLEASELVYRIDLPTKDDDAMPPKKSHKELTDIEKNILKSWIKQGAKYETHWAYTKIASSPQDSIDSIVSKRLSSEKLTFNKPADARTLTRRLHLDLTGLPPEAPKAGESLPDDRLAMPQKEVNQLVDQLLASPHFGERMAVWWLDAVRYADTKGYHGDQNIESYPFRDYVIKSFNQNKPFNTFTIEQIAGDLLPGAGDEQMIAASYNRLNQSSEEGGVQNEEYIKKYQSERVRTTSTAWLGSTLQCAECHNHKFDPYTMEDYYSFAAFFADIYEAGAWNNEAEFNGKLSDYFDESEMPFIQVRRGGSGFQKDARISGPIRHIQYLIANDEQKAKLTQLYKAYKEEQKQYQAYEKAEKKRLAQVQIEKAQKEKASSAKQQNAQGKKPATNTAKSKHKKNKKKSPAQIKFEKAYQAFYSYQYKLPSVPLVFSGKPREVRILPRGNWMDKSGAVVLPATPRFLPGYAAPENGKRLTRLDLAKWIVREDNPLTARVFMNRMWDMFFETGLSRVVNDLGLQGEWPEHPELLDYLATEFIASDWDIKHMVKLIVTSQTYQQSSMAGGKLWERDPENRLLARQTPRRLEGEFIRDHALAASGLLNHQLFGSANHPYQPADYWRFLTFPKRKYKPSTGQKQYRRGLYTHWQRTFLHPMLVAFDVPNRDECAMDRPESNTPMQALTLMNDPTFVEAARALADQVVSIEDDNQRIREAFRIVLYREPETQELDLLAGLLHREKKRLSSSPERVETIHKNGHYQLKDLSEASTKMEVAAMTAVTRAILNMHETITKY